MQSLFDVDEQSKISQSDKDAVRDHILMFVVQVPPLLRYNLLNFTVLFLVINFCDTFLYSMSTAFGFQVAFCSCKFVLLFFLVFAVFIFWYFFSVFVCLLIVFLDWLGSLVYSILILLALISKAAMYRVQLGECLKTIIHADYPEQWPRLLDWIKHNLQDQQVYGALFVLRILSRKYE